MNIKKIENLKGQFLSSIQDKVEFPYGHLRKATKCWLNNFDGDSTALAENIDHSLDTKKSGRLWEGEQYSIKSGIITLIKEDTAFYRSTLKDLFNENLDVEMRFNRYIYHCDQILQEIKSKSKKVNTHYQSYYSASLILSLEKPHLYTPYIYNEYVNLMKYLEVRNIPLEQEVSRYMKTISNLVKVIQKDENFMEIYYSKLPDDAYFGMSNALGYECMLFLTENIIEKKRLSGS